MPDEETFLEKELKKEKKRSKKSKKAYQKGSKICDFEIHNQQSFGF